MWRNGSACDFGSQGCRFKSCHPRFLKIFDLFNAKSKRKEQTRRITNECLQHYFCFQIIARDQTISLEVTGINYIAAIPKLIYKYSSDTTIHIHANNS